MVKFVKDPIYRTKVIVRNPVWTPALQPKLQDINIDLLHNESPKYSKRDQLRVTDDCLYYNSTFHMCKIIFKTVTSGGVKKGVFVFNFALQ